MGLFGYNEKDYSKNTQLFKRRLQAILDNTQDRGVSNFGVGKTIAGLMVMMDKIPYSKSGKEYKVVDEQIEKLLSSMEQDAMKKNMAGLTAHADLLHKELDESRRFGKNAFTDEERQAEEVRSTALGNIHDSLNRLGVIANKKEQLIQAGAKAATEADRKKLGLEYNTLVAEEKSLNQIVGMWTSRYNSAIQVINARRTTGKIDALEAAQVVNVRDFEKEMAKPNQKLQVEMEKDNEISNITNDFSASFDETMAGMSGMTSGFEAAVEDQKNRNLQNEMGAAPSGQGAPAEQLDPFEQALRNMNN